MLNKDFFLLFILAHLTGDYVLQTNRIAKMKSESYKGVAVHTLLVCFAQMLCLSFYGIWGIAAALSGAGIHFLIDSLKILFRKYLKKIELPYFFIDQLLHLLVILLLTLLFAPVSSGMGSDAQFARLFIGLILLFYTSTVTAKMVIRNLFPDMKKRKFFEEYERWGDAFTAGLLYASYLIHPVVSLFVLTGGAFVYRKVQAAAYKYNFREALAKLLTLALFAYLAVLIIDKVRWQVF